MSSVKHQRGQRTLLRSAALAVSFVGSISLSATAQEASPAPAAETSSRDPVVACLDNHTEGQKLRNEGKLIESRDAFRQCSATGCPSQIIRDCLGWMEETQKQIPSVAVAVTVDGASRADVKVYIDDVLATERLSGRAIDVNPGPHEIRVVVPPFEPHEETLVVLEGDKFRLVNAKFVTPGRENAPAGPGPVTTEPEVEMHRPIPLATYVLGGVGIAAAISGTAWGLSNVSLKSDMERPVADGGCAPNCQDDAINVLKQRALVADISWGVSIVSMAAAATLYFLRPEEPLEQPIAVDVRMIPSGALGTISVTNF